MSFFLQLYLESVFDVLTMTLDVNPSAGNVLSGSPSPTVIEAASSIIYAAPQVEAKGTDPLYVLITLCGL